MPTGLLILVSTSARALVQAARRTGLPACAVDAFGDADTLAQVERWHRCALAADGGLDADSVMDAIAGFGPEPATIVLGSGLESRPDVIARIEARHTLAGNTATVWRLAHDPQRWSALALSLGLPCPAMCWAPPADAACWLRKRAGSSGGQHVLPASDQANGANVADEGWYFQRRIEGEAYSLLFLADGQDMLGIGFNRLLAAPPEAGLPWAWAGAVRPAGLDAGVRLRVLHAAQVLTQAFGLRGLNGLDFVVQGEDWFLLELNPRPTATLDLWDVGPMPPLLDLHFRACAGQLPSALPQLTDARALAVAYAGVPVQLPMDAVWPEACRDRPRGGVQIQAGEPLCTLHACAATASAAVAQVLASRRNLLRDLGCASADAACVPERPDLVGMRA